MTAALAPPEADRTRPADPPGGPARGAQRSFAVKLDVFEGPFDLLLSLLARHKLDLTEVALATVTDDFLAYLHERGPQWDLDTASDFLLVAATLLDLKSARLLPAPARADAEDLELLEARDLLFARLLQYAAYRGAAGLLAHRLREQARCYPREVPLEPALTALLPEVVLGMDAAQFAQLAARALRPRPELQRPEVSLAHLHGFPVDVAEQAALLADRLRRTSAASFRALVADSTSPAVVVARFLALLDLYREQRVAFDQASALGELTVRWTGADAVPEAAPGTALQELR